MLKKILTIAAIAALFASCGNEQKTEENKTETSVETTQAETPEIILGEFDQKAGEFIDKEVKVKGIVDHVCKHGGKKILLVSDDGDVHVNSDTRFEDTLTGNEVVVTGIVREMRIDEGTCLKDEEDNIKSHSEGNTENELFERKKKQIAFYRDSMKAAGVDHLSFYSLEYVSLKTVEKETE
jgi:hypothetical protein